MVPFVKYSANGNDFVVLDNRHQYWDPSETALWAEVCDRHWGVGGDGVLFLENSDKADYRMTYLNSDGREVSMCGNGARALGDFALTFPEFRGKDKLSFETFAGSYSLKRNDQGAIELHMTECQDVEKYDLADFAQKIGASFSYFIDTGVPHCLFELSELNMTREIPELMNFARQVRYDKRFPLGTNVNFVCEHGGELFMRTYERGVEDETQACGTGAVAVARAWRSRGRDQDEWTLNTLGGQMRVRFEGDETYFSGDVRACFKGQFDPDVFRKSRSPRKKSTP